MLPVQRSHQRAAIVLDSCGHDSHEEAALQVSPLLI